MFDSKGMLRKPDPESSSKVSSDGPFFTVLIPTMNRPKLLEAAIRTVMWQTFTDFELIVSDNSNDEKSRVQNRLTVEKYASDPRVHYIRPDRWMNMPDHWEFASRHASGQYVAILTDRHVMRPSALEYLHSQISAQPEQSKVICWGAYLGFNKNSGILILTNRSFTGKTENWDSKEFAQNYAKFEEWKSLNLFLSRLPRLLNSCYRFDIAQTIRKQHGSLFLPVSPDYTAGFLFLAYSDKLVCLDRPLFISHGNQSNGRKSVVYGVEGYASTLGNVDVFAETPIRLKTNFNSTVRDFLAIKNLVGEKLSYVKMDLTGYYLSNYVEIMMKERLGSPLDIGALYVQWWKGVTELPSDQQSKIKEHVRELDRERVSLIGLRRLVVRMGLDPLYHFIVGKLRHVRQRLASKPVYANVFEAAMQTDYMLTDPVETADGKD